MAEVNCGSCRVEFITYKVSKMFHCGHSFCTDCFDRIVSKCPVCDSLCNEDDFQNPRTNSLREEHLHISEILSRFTDTKNLILNLLPKLMFNAPFLQHYKNVNLNDLHLPDVLNVMNNPFNSVKLATKGNVQICLELKDFKDRQEFVPTIVELMTRNYSFCAAQQIGNEILYGKLSIRDDWTDVLFIHSLTESEHEKQANVIWFQDLKQCTEYYYIRTFIEIPNLFMVFTMDNLNVTTHFIRQCTGECGATFKGLRYSTKAFGNTDEIGTITLNGYKKRLQGYLNKPLEYNLGLNVEPSAYQNGFLLQRLETCGFKVLKCSEYNETTYSNIIGMLHEFYPGNDPILGFKSEANDENSFIVDTGIALSTLHEIPEDYILTD